MSLLTLTTDFGTRDGYVGVMKGVILGLNPTTTLVDLSHEIPPQDIAAAAFVLFAAYRYFPAGTVHLVVVDPGVGTERRAIAVQTPQALLVAPDNGVLGYMLGAEPAFRAVALTEPAYWLPQQSHTFHGRDIFAPAAAHLSAGVPLERLGPRVDDILRRPLPEPAYLDERHVRATVLYVDRFGNAITSLSAGYAFAGAAVADLGGRLVARAGAGIVRGLRPSYGAAEAGEALLVVGSSGFVELAVREGSAAGRLGLHAGDTVEFSVE